MNTPEPRPTVSETTARPRKWWSTWRGVVVAVLIGAVVGVLLAVIPVPMVIYKPGPTLNVLGSQGGEPIISYEGQQSADDDPAEGELRMVTVSEQGGPGTRVSVMDLLLASMNSGYSIYKYSQLYGPQTTADEVQQANQAQMTSSHSTATVAALEYLGYDLPSVITIEDVAEGVPAASVLEPADILVSMQVAGGPVVPMDQPGSPFAFLGGVTPGTTVDVTVERAGEQMTLPVETVAPEYPNTDGALLGIVLSFDIDVPVEVNIHLENIGGPSAGMIFALGIIDEMADTDMTGGQSIAGTGTMGYDGRVGAIGGIVQKMHGALRDGSEWFLAPAANCGAVVGNEPKGLTVVAVSNLEDAVAAVTAIGQGNTDALQSCGAYLEAQPAQ